MDYRDPSPESHYPGLANQIARLNPRRILMGGLGNAELPRRFPNTHFTVVEANTAQTCALPNVRVVYGDWFDVGNWPEGDYDLIVSDPDGLQAHTILADKRAYQFAPAILARVYLAGGVAYDIVARVYRG